MRLFPWRKRRVQEPDRPAAPPAPLLSYRAASLQGIGTRQRQEDAFAFANLLDVTLIREKGLLAVVADGMGGMADGRLASDTAVRSIREGFEGLDYTRDLAAQLEECVFQANQRVYEAIGGRGGTTAIACLFYDGQLYFTSVGDSFLFLKRGGQLVRLNQSHTVLRQRYLDCLESGVLDPEGARQDPERAALTHFLGLASLRDADSLKTPLPLMAGDVLLLCSDGVGGVLSEEELLACLGGASPSDMCAALEQGVQRAGRKNQDNYTVLAVQCEY